MTEQPPTAQHPPATQQASAAERPLAALYLFNGDDSLKQETLVERLKQRIAALGDVTMNTQVFFTKDIANPAMLLDALNTMPFGSPKRLVVIKEAQTLSKTLQDALITYMKQPSETTVLALSAKFPSNSRVLKAVQGYSRQSVVDCG
ncbi:MAG: hypothetical protein LBU31_02340, partial [Coriobacteriales bacterium]|nr:hypothetical protein [Coriobacteriales bacterium]